MVSAATSSNSHSWRARGAAASLLAVGGFLVGYVAFAPWLLSAPAPNAVTGDLQPPEQPATLRRPAAGLSAEEVVEIQMRALSECRFDRSAIHQVYAFASASNRAKSGPITRFERMIFSAPYETLVVNNHWHAGRAALNGDMATVLVTVVGPRNDVKLYRFYLSRQRDERGQECWVTDYVVSLHGGDPATPRLDDPHHALDSI